MLFLEEVQKRIKTFYIKCRLKVDLELFTYIYLYLKAAVKKFYNYYSYLDFNTFTGLIEPHFHRRDSFTQISE